MACHVTASPNHQTKRETPLKYRFDVAMCGRLGFELHPKDLSPEDLEYAKGRVAQYKRLRPIVQQGDLYRLASPYENPYSALMYVDEAKEKAVFFLLGLADKQTVFNGKIRLQGLNDKASYMIEGKTYTGEKLMNDGLELTLKGAYDSKVLEIIRAQAD